MTWPFALYFIAACCYLLGSWVLFRFLKTEHSLGRWPAYLFWRKPRIPGQLKRFVTACVLLAASAGAIIGARVLGP